MPETPKYFLYTRKSTDVEDKQVRSIDAQLYELREFAAREHLTVIEELIEKQSAKQPGRPIFNAMIERIEAGEASGIISWHPDRLARNSVDGGRIVYLVDTGKIKALKFPTTWFENTPQGKFMLSMAFVQSKYYVDSLSESTKRGMREKVRRGEYPSRAPLGYRNDYRIKRIIIDRERAPLVKTAFRRYATGKETLDSLREWFATRDIRSSGGKLLGAWTVSYMLSNPLYYGHFRHGGEIHEGIHEPIISKKLFDDVQAVLTARWRYSPSEATLPAKPFLGLLRCAECGCAITAEIQKGHTYYRCTRKNKLHPHCSQPYIREELLDAEISTLLAPFSLRLNAATYMRRRIDTEQEQNKRAASDLAAQKRAKIEKLNERRHRLQDALLDGIVENEDYVTEKAKILSQKKTLEEQTAALTSSSRAWLEPFKTWISEAQTLSIVSRHGSLTEKRGLAKKVFGSNLLLTGKKARGEAVKPWSFLADNELSHDIVHLFEAARKHFQELYPS